MELSFLPLSLMQDLPQGCELLASMLMGQLLKRSRQRKRWCGYRPSLPTGLQSYLTFRVTAAGI